MDDLFEENMSLRCKVKELERTIEEFKSGKRYLKLQKDYHRVAEGYIKEINRLRSETAAAHIQAVKVRNIWTDECYRLWDEHRAEVRQKNETIRRLEDKIWEMKQKNDEKIEAVTREYEDRIYERDCIIRELTNKLAHAQALLGRDGTNTGTPTSQTPPEKKKRIPNTRTKTNRRKGGQIGHKKHSLDGPDEAEITDIVVHDPVEEGFFCPSCDGENYIPTGKTEIKYEYDIQVKVIRRKHIFYYYKCMDCGTMFRSVIPPNLKEDVQYGSGIQAMALSLSNTVNAAMNKTAMFLSGITGAELTPCEGYIAKLQVRAAKGLSQFREDLKVVLIARKIVYWDDTVIMILTKRGCFRFYGDEMIAYYTAHEHKDMAGIEEDQVLELLTEENKVMHDHNTLNYNEKYKFMNIECNQHLQRDCQKNTDATNHQWSADLKEHIGKTIKERKDVMTRGETSFSSDYIQKFNEKIDQCISEGWEQNEKDSECYGAVFEAALLRRIEKYRVNYFMWVEDFSLPTTNNLSERGLRGVKSHMKISGQFESVAAADNYALIKTYIETCRRNSINEINALQRLCEGNPYTVQEIFSDSPP